MNLIEVNNKKLARDFLDLPKRLYQDDLNWICPLDNEIEGIFTPSKNSKFEDGEAIRWLLVNDRNETIGRIAAFYNKKLINNFNYPTGDCGFFECINSKEAAFILFDTAVNWLKERGIKAMQGPVNFGENYNHWGLLVEGFVPQSYAMPYNFNYYQELFESYGFQDYFKQYSYTMQIHGKWPDRMIKFAKYVASRPNYSFQHFDYKRLDEFVGYFVDIYNVIWSAFHENYVPLKSEEIRKMLLASKSIIDPSLIWFAFDAQKPIGFLAVTPDANQVIAKLKNGKLNFINKLKFLYYKKRAITRSRLFVGGVHPEYQNSGIIGAVFVQLLERLKAKKNQEYLDLGWVGDYNKKMQSIYSTIGAEHAKTHITYLKLFDSELQFERFNNEFEGKLYDYQKKI